MWSNHYRQVVLEPPWHGDRIGAEVSRCQGSDEGGQVRPAHREVAGENISEALVEISLGESNEGGRHVLLEPAWARRR